MLLPFEIFGAVCAILCPCCWIGTCNGMNAVVDCINLEQQHNWPGIQVGTACTCTVFKFLCHGLQQAM